jgi:cyclopropane-fatty-acyl-phospholipid synthase
MMKKDLPHGVSLHFHQPERSGAQTPPTGLEKSLIRLALRMMGNPAINVTLWDDELLYPERKGPGLVIKKRPELWRMLTQPTLYFGDSYCLGHIEVEGGLLSLLEQIYAALDRRQKESAQLANIANLFYHLRGNPIERAKDNIHHHYDIGNDFYRLWLDEEMAYTCAYFAPGVTTLEAAQLAKMEHVCRKLRLKPGETVIEAGCGWGSLARYMALNYGVKVRAYNISHEQIVFAQERAEAEGFNDRVEYIEDDYRNISGNCDAFVSVGMLEHVGVKHYSELGAIIDRTLSAGGRGLIHSISQNQPIPINAWVRRRIFPGGYTPTLRQMMNILEPYDFSVLDVENLRLHYAQTLKHWLERFDNHQDEVRSMYDENFIRAWRLYLCGSMANFTGGYLQLFQVLFSRPQNNALPITRDDLYH